MSATKQRANMKCCATQLSSWDIINAWTSVHYDGNDENTGLGAA
jgi:hypothetical protein